MIEDAIIARLRGMVPGLAAVDGAGPLAELLERNAAPPVTPAAYVIHLGMRGEQAAIRGLAHLQNVRQTVAVVLFARGSDRTGAQAKGSLEPLIDAVLLSLSGWAPGDEGHGPLVMTRGVLAAARGGLLTYTIEFDTASQIRVTHG